MKNHFPFPLTSTSGGLIDDETPFICGGTKDVNGETSISQSCFFLNESGYWVEDQVASLHKGRAIEDYGSVVLDDKLLVSPSFDQSDPSGSVDTFELVSHSKESTVLNIKKWKWNMTKSKCQKCKSILN